MANDISKAYSSFLSMKSKITPQAKGEVGEKVLLKVVQKFQESYGGTIIHSFKYPYYVFEGDRAAEGNLFLKNNQLTHITRKGLDDEIDILYINKYCISVIECKAYGSGKIGINDLWWTYKQNTDKNPVVQEEKHCRHLYHYLFDLLPDGETKYIQPMVVFVDKTIVEDTRSKELKKYVPVCILNNTLKAMSIYSKGERPYEINQARVIDRLKDIMISGTFYT